MLRNGPLKISNHWEKAENGPGALAKISSQSLVEPIKLYTIDLCITDGVNWAISYLVGMTVLQVKFMPGVMALHSD